MGPISPQIAIYFLKQFDVESGARVKILFCAKSIRGL